MGIASPWSEVVSSDPPTTFAAFEAIIPIAERTVRDTVWVMVSCTTRLVTLRRSKTCGSVDSPPFPPLRTGHHVLDRQFGFALPNHLAGCPGLKSQDGTMGSHAVHSLMEPCALAYPSLQIPRS